MDLDIRPASLEEFATAIDWAQAEGWNPGLHDLEVFHATDPKGFWMAFDKGDPVGSISVVRYGPDFGFLGFYIVPPERRGEGIGWALWQKAIGHLDGATVGLDGVVDQQENYRKSGFVLQGRNLRFSGVPASVPQDFSRLEVRSFTEDHRPALLEMDTRFFAVPRPAFLSGWVTSEGNGARTTMIAKQDGAVVGFATVRRCFHGFKIGPLAAPGVEVAEALVAGLHTSLPAGSDLTIDVPESNQEAVRIAEQMGLTQQFETARMYRGRVPDFPMEKCFGITTFELG